MSALSDPNSLMPSIIIMSLDMPPISALVDSGSSHCFIDLKYVNKHCLETYAIPPLELRLLDGSLNTFVTKATKLNIQFSTGKVTSETFFVTPLDSSCVLILGHSWLTHYNLLIDWVLGHNSKEAHCECRQPWYLLLSNPLPCLPLLQRTLRIPLRLPTHHPRLLPMFH